jgi:hypothetical protein
MIDVKTLSRLSEVQIAIIQEYVRVAKEANTEAHELLRLLDAGHMPTLHKHLKANPLLNPYSILRLADLIGDRTHRTTGRRGADALHGQRNRPEKKAALDWFETVRGSVTKDEAAKVIAQNFNKSERTARDWLKGV